MTAQGNSLARSALPSDNFKSENCEMKQFFKTEMKQFFKAEMKQ